MIRTKIVHGKVDILLIDGLPEDDLLKIAIRKRVHTGKDYLTTTDRGGLYSRTELPPGNWQPVNWLDKISEEEAKELVEILARVFNGPVAYKSYDKYNEWFWTAKESLLSLVESEVKTNNKYGDEPKAMTHCSGNPKVAEIVTGAFKKQWQAEEAKVWKNIYILKKIN